MNSKYHKIMWGFAGTFAALLIVQVYAVRELLAAFALFAVPFGAVVLVFFALYMLHCLTEEIAPAFRRAGLAFATWSRNGLIAWDGFAHRLSLVHRFNQTAPAMTRIRHHSARGGSL